MNGINGNLSVAIFLFFFVVMFAAMFAGVIAVVLGTVNKTNWGINLQPVRCPRCGTVQPRVRMPGNGRQAMWGGSTCPSCGLELDKWGRPVTVN